MRGAPLMRHAARLSSGYPSISPLCPFQVRSSSPPGLEVEMEGRHGEKMSDSEREENASAQSEELEALEAIYGEGCQTGRSASSAAPEVGSSSCTTAVMMS